MTLEQARRKLATMGATGLRLHATRDRGKVWWDAEFDFDGSHLMTGCDYRLTKFLNHIVRYVRLRKAGRW